MRKRKIMLKVTVPLFILSLVILLAGFSCSQQSQTAATAVNKYGNTLSAFQDAAHHEFKAGRIDESTYRSILVAEQTAARAGKQLDQAILLANQGAPMEIYIELAHSTFADLLATTKAIKDPQTMQTLLIVTTAAKDALENAIGLIREVRPVKTPASGMAIWLMFPLMGMAAAGFALADVAKLLLAIEELEPIAFQLILNLVRNLKGKTTEEIVAMNEALFNKVDQQATNELAELDAGGPIRPPRPPRPLDGEPEPSS